MRLYCLTSISKVPSLPNSQNLTQSSEEVAYKLTEICFGYEYYQTKDDSDEERKHYVMKIYQNKMRDPFSTLMTKGAISLTEVPNKKYAFDLRIATSKLSQDGEKNGYDFIVKIRNIKNTQTRGLLSEEEEKYYEKYSQKIAEIWKLKNRSAISPESMADTWDDAFDEISESQPFKLPNTSKVKFLQQKIRDMKNMIYLLCDPQTGSYKNMPLPKVITDPATMKITTIPCRFDQKIECLLYKKLKQFRIEKRSNAKQAKNYRDCPEIMWIEPNLAEIDLDGVNFGNLRDVCIKKADLRFSKKFIHPVFKKINFKALTDLRLIKCNILELSDNFFNLLPTTLESLNLHNNNITYVSNNISKFFKLKTLYLSKNRNLVEIPWNFLPSSITNLNLKKTNIKIVPSEIERFKNLWFFGVSSKQLDYISWKSFHLFSSLNYLFVEGPGFAVNDIEDFTVNTELTEIKVLNIGLKEISGLNTPLSDIRFLDLSSNKLENLFFEKDTIAKLREIDLENNQMKCLNFGEMFTELTRIFVDQNELTSIDFISSLPNLEFLSAKKNKIKEIPESFHKALSTLKLDFNGISELPKTFEESMSGGPVFTPHLSLSYNNFSYFDSNLEEVLWKRLPKKIEILNLNGNDLVYIPGTLCQKQIRNLFIDNCNIQHICPVIYTFAVMKKRKMTISICENSKLEYLPFVPLTIFPKPPSFKERITFEYLHNFHFAIITDNEIFKNNAKFPMNNFKPVYNFDNEFEGEETRIGCKCCAICSKATEEHDFKNLMIMDFGLCFETDETCYEHSEKSKAFPSFKRGQWKTMIKSRMCKECKNGFHEANDKTFEEYKNYLKQKSNKRTAENAIDNNQQQQQLPCSSNKKAFYGTEFDPKINNNAAKNDEMIVEDNIEIEFPMEMFNERESANVSVNDSMAFTYYPCQNEQSFPPVSTLLGNNSYFTPNQLIPPQNFMDFSGNFNNPQTNFSQPFYQNMPQHNEIQPQFQCQYYEPNPVPIPATESNTFQNNYVENIVLLDQQGNYVTTIQNGNSFNVPPDSHILNPENY